MIKFRDIKHGAFFSIDNVVYKKISQRRAVTAKGIKWTIPVLLDQAVTSMEGLPMTCNSHFFTTGNILYNVISGLQHNPTTCIAYTNKNGTLERDDGPALIINNWENGHPESLYFHYKNGTLHRINGPAVHNEDGSAYWYFVHDKLTRFDGPACYDFNKTLKYSIYGITHRSDGPAIITHDGRKEWWVHGKQHRLDGPAIEWPSGSKEWYLYGHLHRSDGPALESVKGRDSYFLFGHRYADAFALNLALQELGNDTFT